MKTEHDIRAAYNDLTMICDTLTKRIKEIEDGKRERGGTGDASFYYEDYLQRHSGQFEALEWVLEGKEGPFISADIYDEHDEDHE